MMLINLASPWYPLALATANVGKPMAVQVPYEHWLLWRSQWH